MDIRTAILRAADSIERNPGLFAFHSIVTPDCGTPGCAIGWIDHHLGGSCNERWDRHGVLTALGLTLNTHGQFYDRMDALFGSAVGGCYWADNARDCANTLRLYADKYHPAEPPKHEGIPQSVRSIFDEVAA